MRDARGFTLIEMIVAVTLFALLMSSYYVVLNRAMFVEEYARDERAFGTLGPAIFDQIEDDLLCLYSHPRARAAQPLRGEDDSLASMAADSIDFVARRASIRQEEFFGDDQWVRSPINEVGYRLARGDPALGDVRRLFRRESFYVDGTPLQGGDFYEVYDRVVAFDVTYAGYAVEEAERASREDLGEHRLDKFESWDSEERNGFPTAVILTMTVEPPRMSRVVRDEERTASDRRTFVRVIRLPQAEDVYPPEPGTGGGTSTPR
jgi:prepilin-type N-terminal cleavage/methylation domain-containing protein